jgi:hypothetical protein
MRLVMIVKTDYYGGTAPASEIETKFLVNIIEKIQTHNGIDTTFTIQSRKL